MAAIARQTWANLRDEVMKRAGRSGVTAFQSRAEYLLDSSYRLLCQTWHHPELDTISSELTLSSGASSVVLPADLYLPIGARLLDNASTFVAWLQPEHPRVLLGRGRSSTAQPKFYCRFADTLYVDNKADAAYKVQVFYYKNPTTPDFADSATPEVDRVFDEILIQWATAMAQNHLWRPELGSVGLQTVSQFLSRMGHPLLASGGTIDDREAMNTETRLAGALS